MCIYIAIPKFLGLGGNISVEDINLDGNITVGHPDKAKNSVEMFSRAEFDEKFFFVCEDEAPENEYALHHKSKPRPYIIDRCKTLIEYLRTQDKYRRCKINVIVHWGGVDDINDLRSLSHELLKRLLDKNIAVGYISSSIKSGRKELYDQFEKAFKKSNYAEMHGILDKCLLKEEDLKSDETRVSLEAVYNKFQDYLIHRFLDKKSINHGANISDDKKSELIKTIRNLDSSFEGFSNDENVNDIRAEFIGWLETNSNKMS
jgi:hypothetical protein